MKKYPIYSILIALLIGYFGYRWFSGRPPKVWNYIPATASVIVSSNHLQEFLTPESDTISGRYRDLPLISLAAGSLSLVKWFNQDPQEINRFLSEKTITYAFHPLAGNRLGIVIYLPVKNDLEKKWLENPKAGGLREGMHSFQGYSITDISNQRSEHLFSYLLKDDFLIVSQYGELIEDIIRNEKSGKSAASKSGEFLPLPEGTHELSIYANGSSWRNYVLPPNSSSSIHALLDLLPSSYGFHLARQSENTLSFHSEEARATDAPLNQLLSDQAGTAFVNNGHISQRTTHLLRIGLSNDSKFKTSFRKWLSQRRSLAAVSAFEKAMGKERDAFYHQIGAEIMLTINENTGGQGDNKLALIRFDDYEKIKPALARAAGNTQPTPAFQNFDIYPLLIPDLMEGLFGPIFKGFRESHITFVEPYLIIGNNPQTVRNYLIDFENQLTWAQAPGLDSLGIYSKADAQLYLISNMSKVRAQNEGRKTGLRTSLDEITTTVLSYQKKGKYITLDLDINYEIPNKGEGQNILKAELEWKDSFPSYFSAMLNPLDGTSEILLTNSRNQLVALNPENGTHKLLAELNEPLVGRVYKADFLNIGRQQRIVATASSLVVIDEDENGVLTVLQDPAPVPVLSMDRVNDSRESSARFILRGADQNLYIWERVHQRPYSLNKNTRLENVLSPVVSSIIEGANYQIITQADGKVLALNDQGKNLSGFPFDMLSGIRGAFGTTHNISTGQTNIQGVNRQGEFIKIRQDGAVQDRRQLLLPEAGCSFRTLFDENSLDWLILRQTGTKAAILSKEGNEIFEIVNLKKDFSLKYHYFGSDNRFISVVSGGIVSIFDFNGNRIGDTSIPCHGALGITYKGTTRELTVFSQGDGKIQVWSIKLQ